MQFSYRDTTTSTCTGSIRSDYDRDLSNIYLWLLNRFDVEIERFDVEIEWFDVEIEIKWEVINTSRYEPSALVPWDACPSTLRRMPLNSTELDY